MTSTAIEPHERSDAPEAFDGLEVATVAGDTLRASIRISGTLTAGTVSLVASVLRTHMTAGRRYLRVDLATARISDQAVVAALAEAHGAVQLVGGMLVFENAAPQIAAALHDASLFVRAAER